MKTQISRHSFAPEQRYSGVYQQMGRMITDADWNELNDLVQHRLVEALTDVIGDGSPVLADWYARPAPTVMNCAGGVSTLTAFRGGSCQTTRHWDRCSYLNARRTFPACRR